MNNKVDFIIRVHRELDERAKVLESKDANQNECTDSSLGSLRLPQQNQKDQGTLKQLGGIPP